MSLKMLEEQTRSRRADLDSICGLAAVLVDSLPVSDPAAVALKRVIQQDGAGCLGRLEKVPQGLISLPEGRVVQVFNDPRLRLASLIREAGFLERRISALEVEAWKKISIPCASLVFVLLGAPLGRRRDFDLDQHGDFSLLLGFPDQRGNPGRPAGNLSFLGHVDSELCFPCPGALAPGHSSPRKPFPGHRRQRA
jgi:hypothetical protein